MSPTTKISSDDVEEDHRYGIAILISLIIIPFVAIYLSKFFEQHLEELEVVASIIVTVAMIFALRSSKLSIRSKILIVTLVVVITLASFNATSIRIEEIYFLIGLMIATWVSIYIDTSPIE